MTIVVVMRTSPVKATAAWQLFNYAQGEATARGRNVLVCLYPGRGRGAVFVSKDMLRSGLRTARPSLEASLQHDARGSRVR